MSTSKQLSLDLPPATFVEADGGTRVDPVVLTQGATISVSYPDMKPDDQIDYLWETRPGEYAPIEPIFVDTSDQHVEFHIPPSYVGFRVDGYTRFTYSVTRAGEQQQSTWVTRIRITLPSDRKAPSVPEASGDVLDLALLCCEAPSVYVPVWSLMDEGQTIWLDISGYDLNGQRISHRLVVGERVTNAEVAAGWSRPLPMDFLKALKHDSQVVFSFSVGFSQSEAESDARSFPPSYLRVLTENYLDLDAPIVVEATQVNPELYALNPVNSKQGATVRLGYVNLCACDWVCVFWSSTEGGLSTHPQSLGCKQADSQEHVDFQLPVALISLHFDQNIYLKYSVRRDGEFRGESPVRRVKILDISGLPAPQVEQATGNTLDLNTFDADATGIVPVWDYIALDQPCWLWVTGEAEDGSALSFEVLEGEPVTAEWLSSGVNTALPRAELQKLADCRSFDVHFAVNFSGQADKASAKKFPVLRLGLVLEDLVLNAPTVREAVGSELTVYNGRDGVTVRVEYERMSSRHEIGVQWVNPGGASVSLVPKSGNSDPGYVDFVVPREAVIHGAGKTILISYRVTSACKLAPSKTLGLKISVPVRLPTPVVPQATSGVLDLRAFTSDAEINVEKWWFILPDQKVWLGGAGTKKDGSAYTLNVYLGKAVTAAEVNDGLSGLLKRSELELLKDASLLTFTCKVTADGGAQESASVVFPSLTLTVRALPEIRHENFTGLPNRLISAGQSIDISTMTITLLAGSGGTAGIYYYKWPTAGMLDGQAIVVCYGSTDQIPGQRINVDFKWVCQRVKFAYTWQRKSVEILFYDSTNSLIGRRDLPTTPSESDQRHHWVDFTAPTGKSIASMVVSASDFAFMDFFTLWGV